MRDCAEQLLFRPQLAPGWQRLRFAVRPRGRGSRWTSSRARSPTRLHGDEAIESPLQPRQARAVKLKPGKATTRKWSPVELLTDAPLQPLAAAGHAASAAELIPAQRRGRPAHSSAVPGVLAIRRGEGVRGMDAVSRTGFSERFDRAAPSSCCAPDHAALRIALGSQPFDGPQPVPVGRAAVGLVAHPAELRVVLVHARQEEPNESVVLDMAAVVEADSVDR